MIPLVYEIYKLKVVVFALWFALCNHDIMEGSKQQTGSRQQTVFWSSERTVI